MGTASLAAKMRQTVLISCHQALIYLGDLSRYREESSTGKEPNWAPAIGFYDLAQAIYPTSGASHHQRAVIARYGGSHLHITYHLYRSLASEEPHPSAHDNLNLEMKKIGQAHFKGKLVPEASNATSQTPEMVVAYFLLVYSRLYKGDNLSRNEDLEDGALALLASSLQDRSMEGGTLNKLVLINIAAQYSSSVKFQGKFRIISLISDSADCRCRHQDH